jgi:predicted ribosomally synthesized peptide with nif11-like leader
MMSQEQAMAFIQRVNQDEPLRSKIGGLSRDLNALLSLAAETGYAFTAVEWKVAMQQAQAEQLSESELDGVAGGAGPTTSNNWISPFSSTGLAGILCNSAITGGLSGKS